MQDSMKVLRCMSAYLIDGVVSEVVACGLVLVRANSFELNEAAFAQQQTFPREANQ